MANVTFCADPLWDQDRTWRTHRPDFTRCFHQTCLALAPSAAFLALLAPLQLLLLRRRPEGAATPTGTRFRCRLLLAAAMAAIQGGHLVMQIVDQV